MEVAAPVSLAGPAADGGRLNRTGHLVRHRRRLAKIFEIEASSLACAGESK